jgi:hypothetical protein
MRFPKYQNIIDSFRAFARRERPEKLNKEELGELHI